jgi:predicted TPR repeat methyltransferase
MYEDWGDQYAVAMKEWSYNTPAEIAQLVKAHSHAAGRVLDLGAGVGLSGVALASAGFGGNITAVDISPKLLELALARGVYAQRIEADLSGPLPLDSTAFQIVVCVGTLTYVKPTCGVLEEMVRVCKQGGTIAFNLRTDHIDAWETALDRLEQEGKWKLLEKRGPIAYCPNNAEYGDKVQTILFIFRAL